MIREEQKFYGNYLGICVCNTDPEQRGRVQIFVPHVLPALDERWNKEGVDKFIECTGDNIELALSKVDIDQLKLMLPWAEAAAPIFGNSVSGHYNDQSGNFNQTYGTETEAAAAANPTPINSGAISVGADGRVNKGELLGFLEGQIANSSLNGFIPSDGAAHGIDGSPSSWANYLFHLANRESSYNTNTVGDIGRFTGNSNGLFQLSPLDYNNYRGAMQAAGIQPGTTINGQPAFSQQQLTDPVVNSTAAIVITQQLVRQDGAIGSNASTGAARYWGPLRKGWTAPPPSIDLNKPQEALFAPSSNPAQASPHLQPTPPPYTQPEPSQEAIQSTQGTQAPTSGTVSSRLGLDVWSKATSGLSVNHCGKRARLFDHALLSGTNGYNGYFTNGLTLNTGSASANDSTNYWVSSGYYTKATSVPSVLPFGTKLIFNKGLGSAGKIHGHVTTVADGRLLGSGAGENYNAYANLNNGEVTVLLPTQKYADAFEAKYGSELPTYALDQITNSGPLEIDPTPGSSVIDPDTPDVPAENMVRNPTDTQPTVTDTTGMPQGLFSVPNPGAMLWVFFRGGDPLYPVYFAASYGSKEWGNAYKRSSPGAHYPALEDTTPRNQAIFRPNQSGGMTFTDTITDQEDCRSVRIFHSNGGYFEFNIKGSVHYSPNEHMQQIAGNLYSSCLNRENWTQGTNNNVTIGDRVTIVGNVSPEALAIIEEHAQIVKKINQNMLKQGGGSSSGGSGATRPHPQKPETPSTPSEILNAQSSGLGDVALNNQDVLQQVGAASSAAGANVSVQQADRYAKFGNAVVEVVNKASSVASGVTTATVVAAQGIVDYFQGTE
jgi:hypothetical protein